MGLLPLLHGWNPINVGVTVVLVALIAYAVGADIARILRR